MKVGLIFTVPLATQKANDLDQLHFTLLSISFDCCRKLDIVDSVLKKLEKHAENLEATVSRRAAELEGEKQKTELLLYRMLPQSVYELLEHFCQL